MFVLCNTELIIFILNCICYWWMEEWMDGWMTVLCILFLIVNTINMHVTCHSRKILEQLPGSMKHELSTGATPKQATTFLADSWK